MLQFNRTRLSRFFEIRRPSVFSSSILTAFYDWTGVLWFQYTNHFPYCENIALKNVVIEEGNTRNTITPRAVTDFNALKWSV